MSSLLLGQGDIVAEKSRKALQGKWQGSVEIHKYFHIYLHSFTFAVVDDKDMECEIRRRIKHFHTEPGWRNWQTQRTQKTACRLGKDRFFNPFHKLARMRFVIGVVP